MNYSWLTYTSPPPSHLSLSNQAVSGLEKNKYKNQKNQINRTFCDYSFCYACNGHDSWFPSHSWSKRPAKTLGSFLQRWSWHSVEHWTPYANGTRLKELTKWIFSPRTSHRVWLKMANICVRQNLENREISSKSLEFYIFEVEVN